MTTNPISPATEAQLIMKLYDLRRETEMRKARKFVLEQFWPASFDDIVKFAMDMSSQENAWFRQVASYWEMAASFVVHGAISPGLFYDNCGEMWALYVKMRPFLKQGREMWNSHEFLHNVEKVAEGTSEGRDRTVRIEARMKQMMEARAKKAGG